MACLVGRTLDAKANYRWLWKGRRVYMFDGTTVTMPDTPENQAAYPQVYNQKPGLGFPIARIGALTSLSCGAIVISAFADMPARDRVKSAYSADCGTCFVPEMFCWPIV